MNKVDNELREVDNRFTIENWEQRFDKAFVSLSDLYNQKGFTGTRNMLKDFIRTELDNLQAKHEEEIIKAEARGREEGLQLRKSYTEFNENLVKEAVRIEKAAWIAGERCEFCGEAKEPSLTFMCDKCFKSK